MSGEKQKISKQGKKGIDDKIGIVSQEGQGFWRDKPLGEEETRVLLWQGFLV